MAGVPEARDPQSGSRGPFSSLTTDPPNKDYNPVIYLWHPEKLSYFWKEVILGSFI